MKNNPLVEKKRLSISRKSSKKNQEMATLSPVKISLIGMNDYINICARACSCCWDKQIPDDYEGQADYVSKRSKTGHTSIIEHSNFIVLIEVYSEHLESLLEFCDWIKYLNHKIVKSVTEDKWYMILGGSLRGFADIYRNTSNMGNIILKSLTGLLYEYTNSAVFQDLCELGILEEDRFQNFIPDNDLKLLRSDLSGYENELFEIVGLDDISKLAKNLNDENKEIISLISTYDLISFVTVTVLFKDMSRSCTHQLVRHRNAITQESQRYVDYSKSCFNSPDMFKPEKYDKDHKYTIRFGPSSQMHMTLEEIGKAECDLYGMLTNPAITGNDHALIREDARSFLPTNVQCKKIYMTFTYKNLFKFLELREDKAAQVEIRKYALSLGEFIRNNTSFKSKELTDLYTKPRVLIEDPFSYNDEIMDEYEEVIELTEEDYMHMTGLEGEDTTIQNPDNLKNGDEV